jgi:peroxiredoxin
MRKSFLIGGLCLVLSALGCEDVAVDRIEVGREVPSYGAVTLAGDSVHLGQYVGQVVLLNVWATWCLPCREEMPALQELYERHMSEGFEVVAVSVDGPREGPAIRRFVADYGLTFPIWHDPNDGVMSKFRVVGVPATYLIDRSGVLRWRHMGPITADDPTLLGVLREALADS